jgi:hypothetical protein
MRKIVLLLMLMSAMVWAQDNKNSNTKNSGLKTKTVTGCIHKEGDNIWLTTRMGKYHLMSKEDLSAHEGHTVKVTGEESKGAVPGGDPKKNVNHLEVSNIEMVKNSCKMGEKKAPKTP